MRILWIGAGAAALVVAAIAAGVAVLDDGGDTDSVATDAASDGSPDPGDDPGDPAGSANGATTIPQIPGDPGEDVPSALDDMRQSEFPDPLVDPDQIRSGGPPPDGIPAIDEPRFEVASEVTWLEGVEPVLSLEIDGEARAYPIQIMTWHEIANDTFGDTPVTVSYCPLCNSAIAYVRQADGRTFDFGTSGRLFNSSLVMYDRQTESLWSHFTGEAVVGTLTGTTLETLPVSTVSWDTFLAAHPDALVLSRETGFNRPYGNNPYPGYDDVDQVPFLFNGEIDGQLPAQTRVVAVRGDTETIAVVQEDLAADGVLHTSVDGEPIVILLEPGTASALDAGTVAGGRDVGAVGVYRPIVDGQPVELERDDSGGFVDAETGSTFDILGRAVDGELSGAALEPVEHLDTFWFAIAAFEPDTRILEP